MTVSQSVHEQPTKGLSGFQEALNVTSHRVEMPRQNSDPTSENPPLPTRIEKFDRSSWLRQEEDIPPKVTSVLRCVCALHAECVCHHHHQHPPLFHPFHSLETMIVPRPFPPHSCHCPFSKLSLRQSFPIFVFPQGKRLSMNDREVKCVSSHRAGSLNPKHSRPFCCSC